jgi:carbamoyltransferase
MKILGIHDGHNASACLLEDGVVRAAVQEERLSRLKNHNGFPARAIQWVLASTGTAPDSLDSVAFNSLHMPYPKTSEQLLEEYNRSQSLATGLKRLVKHTPALAWHRSRRRASRIEAARMAGLPVGRIVFVDHHTCHAAAAYHGSPWKDGKVLVLTADGMGDDLCAGIWVAERGRLGAPVATVEDSHSLGNIYAQITYLMGMAPLDHEYKLMGMAPYAPEKCAVRCQQRFARLLAFDGKDGLTWRRTRGVPNTFYSYRFFRKFAERERFDCLAAGLQRFTETHLATWVANAVRATGIHRVALGGGVFMNVVANLRILKLPEVEELFVFPSCGDETNAIGAAFHVYAESRLAAGREVDMPPLGPIYWGPRPDEAAFGPVLDQLRVDGFHLETPGDLEARVAEVLAAGEVVARAVGPMEFGARALGNRSILADPTKKDVVRLINDMVKKRDFWMPFAPAMLAERSDEYVQNPKSVDAPYMILAFDSTSRSADLEAAVQPYDRSARPQFVHRAHNPEFHRLICGFADRTGRAVLLNTSFNLHGAPIVSSVADAVEVLRNSGLNYLAVPGFLIRKPAVAAG